MHPKYSHCDEIGKKSSNPAAWKVQGVTILYVDEASDKDILKDDILCKTTKIKTRTVKLTGMNGSDE